MLERARKVTGQKPTEPATPTEQNDLLNWRTKAAPAKDMGISLEDAKGKLTGKQLQNLREVENTLKTLAQKEGRAAPELRVSRVNESSAAGKNVIILAENDLALPIEQLRAAAAHELGHVLENHAGVKQTADLEISADRRAGSLVGRDDLIRLRVEEARAVVDRIKEYHEVRLDTKKAQVMASTGKEMTAEEIQAFRKSDLTPKLQEAVRQLNDGRNLNGTKLTEGVSGAGDVGVKKGQAMPNALNREGAASTWELVHEARVMQAEGPHARLGAVSSDQLLGDWLSTHGREVIAEGTVNRAQKFLAAVDAGKAKISTSAVLESQYRALRSADYDLSPRYVETTPSLTGTSGNGMQVLDQKGWHYRLPENRNANGWSTSGKTMGRFSLNVYAEPALIAKLDALCQEHKCYYKTPKDISGWADRHDPITIYSHEEITPELKAKVAKIAAEHVRGGDLHGEIVTKGVAVEASPSVEDITALIKRAEKLHPELGKSVKAQAFSPDMETGKVPAEPKLSAGQKRAIDMLLDSYEKHVQAKGLPTQPEKPQAKGPKQPAATGKPTLQDHVKVLGGDNVYDALGVRDPSNAANVNEAVQATEAALKRLNLPETDPRAKAMRAIIEIAKDPAMRAEYDALVKAGTIPGQTNKPSAIPETNPQKGPNEPSPSAKAGKGNTIVETVDNFATSSKVAHVHGTIGTGLGLLQMGTGIAHGSTRDIAIGGVNTAAAGGMWIANATKTLQGTARLDTINRAGNAVMIGAALTDITLRSLDEKGIGLEGKERATLVTARLAANGSGYGVGMGAAHITSRLLMSLGSRVPYAGVAAPIITTVAALGSGILTTQLLNNGVDAYKDHRTKELASQGQNKALHTDDIAHVTAVPNGAAKVGAVAGNRSQEAQKVAVATIDGGPQQSEVFGVRQVTGAQVQAVPQMGTGIQGGRFS